MRHILSDRAQSILVVMHDLPLGGTERIAIRLANRWAAAGRTVTLFCGERRGALDWMIDPAVEVVECDPPIPRARGSRRRLGEAAAAFLARRRHDVLFIPGNYHWAVAPAVARLPAHQRPGIVAQVSTPLFRHGRGVLRQILYNLRTRLQFARVDVGVSLSPSMTDDVDAVLGRRITQCIRLPALDDDREAPRTRARGKLIVAAGRLCDVKGFDVALRAFARLEDPEARLVILGEGPGRGPLEALAAELGVTDRVELPGYVADIAPWLEAARVFLLSSYYEGYAAVVVEALNAGRPVVATACTPAAYELLSMPGAGAVAPIGDAAAMAAALRQVMQGPAPDPRRLVAAVAGYRIGPIATDYLRVFDTVAARRAPRPVSVAWPAFLAGALRRARANVATHAAASHRSA